MTSTLKSEAGLIPAISTLQDRIREIRDSEDWPKRGWKTILATTAGVSGAAVSMWDNGDTQEISAAAAAAIERKLGWRATWLISGELPKRVNSSRESPPQSRDYWTDLQAIETRPSHSIKWEDIGLSLPDVFETVVPDDSMAPRAKFGDVVKISTKAEPVPGDGILVRDKEGRHYLRVLRERRPGHWEAHAENTNYTPMDSKVDGLTIIGVLVGVPSTRWSR